jgi:hypothetical protein
MQTSLGSNSLLHFSRYGKGLKKKRENTCASKIRFCSNMKLKQISINVTDVHKNSKERIWKIRAPPQHTFPYISSWQSLDITMHTQTPKYTPRAADKWVGPHNNGGRARGKVRKPSRVRRTQDGSWPQVPSTRQIAT